MRDMFGNTLNIGDKVLYAEKVAVKTGRFTTLAKSPLTVGVIQNVTNKTVTVNDTKYVDADLSFVSLEHMDTFMPNIIAILNEQQNEIEEERE